MSVNLFEKWVGRLATTGVASLLGVFGRSTANVVRIEVDTAIDILNQVFYSLPAIVQAAGVLPRDTDIDGMNTRGESTVGRFSNAM